jgi:acetyl-CoA carboxylase biotin carboxyl carrier protein
VARKPGNPSMPKTPAIDHDVIRDLAKLLDETGLTEIEFERDGVSVRVARHLSAPSLGATSLGATSLGATSPRLRSAEAPGSVPAAAAPAEIDPTQHPGAVISPMVGTVYLGPAPGARPFVDVGSQVKTGEPLLIIEAMKTMNQIPAPRSGTVIQVLVGDGQPVEYGQPLMIIE